MLFAAMFAGAQVASLSASNYAVDQRMPARPPVLAWSDEFNGKSLNRSKWAFDASRNKQGWYNGELQYYSVDRPENLRLRNGLLIIEARKDVAAIRSFSDWGGQQYSSAKITTKGKRSFRYGFVEARAKVPCTGGTWPAIWMLPEDSSNWPDGGEIDILEHVGSEPGIAHANLHTRLFNHVQHNGRGAQKAVPAACSAFHRYQLSWTPEAITIGVDDQAYMRVRNDQPGGRGAWPFDRPFYLILNLAMGGSWAAGKGMDDAALPQRFEVDYVRLWQDKRARP